MKKRFIYTVQEILATSGIVLAEDEDEAWDIITAARENCDIVLVSDDYIDSEIEIQPDDGKHNHLIVFNPDSEVDK